MTNTELKNNIDTAITNKTAVSSITPNNVGEQIKSTVDYIDQEIQANISTPNYKIYRAILTQTGTNAPVATVLENTVGNIVWTRNSPGNYSATLVGTFLANKTYYHTFGTSNSFNRVYTNRLNDDVMTIISISEDFTTYLDNELFNFPIEIIVYN